MTPMTSLHRKLAFVDTSLFVSYHASEQPQLLDLRVELEAVCGLGGGPAAIRSILTYINSGAAAGAEFSPLHSRATLLRGPRTDDDEGSKGPIYLWQLEVACVCPLFMRNTVENLALTGMPAYTPLSMAIQGSIPLDRSPLSVREGDVRIWLRDADAFPAAYGQPPFAVRDVDAGGGKDAVIRVRLRDPATKETFALLDTLLTGTWGNYLVCLPARAADPISSFGADHVATSKKELTLRMELFNCRYQPARSALLNIMTRFHHTTAPIEQLDVGLPR